MTDQTVIRFTGAKKTELSQERIPCLTIVEGTHIGQIFRLEKTSMVLGRSDQAEILLQDEGISRQHARIDLHEETYTLTDMESTNGTYVNGGPVEQVNLRDGDKIRMGEVLLRFAYLDSVDVNYQEQLRSMAMRDGLTKLFNRRYFLETLEREFSFAMRQRNPLTLILFDIDHLKSVNETQGHPAGDMVLRAIAQTLDGEVRGYDTAARYGGEEFIVLLRATALENALLFAERVRRMIEALPITFESKPFHVTVSVGVASLDPDLAKSAADLLREADRFLYEAKSKGRNRICSRRDRD